MRILPVSDCGTEPCSRMSDGLQPCGMVGSGPVSFALILQGLAPRREPPHIATMAQKHPKRPTDEALQQKALERWNSEGGAPASGDASIRQHPKRSRDLNQWAKRIVDLVSGDEDDRETSPEEEGKDPAAVALGRKGGMKGGKARADKMTAKERSIAAKKAAQARWSKSGTS